MERDELTMLLAHNIQRVIAEKETNPSQLAKLAELNPTGVYDILSGKSMSPKLDTVRKIANALNVSVACLLQDQSEADLADELLAIIDQLPSEEKRRLLLTARAWVEDPAAPQ
jgi:transcriptional regulator with XRE-family HTH domain